MTPLERELQGLASAVDWPDAPDVSSAVLASIADERPRVAPRRRLLVLALAVLLAALLAVLAVPPARTAILDWLGIGSARIIRVDELPSLAPTPGLEILGQRATLEGARLRAGFPFVDPPDDERAPDEIRVAPGMRVTYVWHEGKRIRLLVTQFPGDATDPGLIKKFVSSGTRIELVSVDGNRALWLEGGPHAVLFVAPDGNVHDDLGWLAGNTLLVAANGLTMRIEAQIDRKEAVELARDLLG